jgi:FAD/FMN-containing dehydrogenase
MKHAYALAAFVAACSAAVLDTRGSSCRCVWKSLDFRIIQPLTTIYQTPTDACWPSKATWSSLNTTVGGQLIASVPIAISCYPGPLQNAAQCEAVDEGWTSPYFQELYPLGLSYPINATCPPVNATAGEVPGTCTLGDNPVYAVNATSNAHVVAAINFAKKNNVRLVIKDTGHDILGRSDGYGSLEIWIHYLRTGLTFQKKFQSTCKATNWTGSTISIGGGYTFTDVYPVAKANNVVVVGGGTPSVGALGGWMQGGGHGPASRQYGLGADQVLSAQVALVVGSIITANACQNQDIYYAIRGGGPGTYGVVLSTIVKAHPNVSVQVQHLAIGPLTTNTSTLLDAITTLYAAFPSLNDFGYAGYGSWSIASPTPLFATFYQGYVSGTYTFNKDLASAEAAFAPTLAKLLPYNMTSLFISVSYVEYPDYWSFYEAESGVEGAAGSSAALGSRLFSRASVANTASLRAMIEVIAGGQYEYTSNNFELVSGGQVFADAADPFSGLNPAWRKSYFSNIVARGWAPGTSEADKDVVRKDVTYNKTAAMKAQAPDTGAYMNEADRLDPDWAKSFYGAHYLPLLAIKTLRDPTGVFYCPTCVGSAAWKEDATGRLCKA